MKLHSYIPVYSLTLLLSAALLFSVQPMFSKMILPLLGGTPQVWNTAMLFFQLMLLGGYAYAHGTTKFLSIRAQALLHLVLLMVFTVVLPFGIPEGWGPPVDHDPTLWQLSLMGITVGGPFFVLAGSAPMLQRWFASTDHPDAGNPYFLYGASNLGSMTALLAYPIVIEPMMGLSDQSQSWATGYMALIAMILLSAVLVWTHTGKANTKKTRAPANDENITWSMRMRWLVLSFVPSSLMLGVTTFITTDIASVPLLWIMPLALYVGTFVIVFARRPLIQRARVMSIQGVLLIVLIVQMMAFELPPSLLILLHLSLFLFSALACHMELAKSRPHANHLTEFYLVMSIGGALGGFFNAIIAPNLFIIPLEYVLVLIMVNFLRYNTDSKQTLQSAIESLKALLNKKDRSALSVFNISAVGIAAGSAILAACVLQTSIHQAAAGIIAVSLFFLIDKRWLFAITTAFILMLYPPGYDWGRFLFKEIIHQDRNFFGVQKVIDTHYGQRVLLHGTTNHGTQSIDERYKLIPSSYYTDFSPLHDPFKWLDRKSGAQKIGVIGLGAGVSACFSKEGRSFDFFEIDPNVVEVARDPDYFTYLSDCGSPYQIIMGDARLTIQNQPDERYDIIMLDAFSSDNIPIHLLTIEMIEIYLKKLKKDGVIVFHISNNYLDIEPVLTNAAEHLNIPGLARVNLGGKLEDSGFEYWSAHGFSMSKNQAYNNFLIGEGWSTGMKRDGVKLWSDQYSNIVSVLGNETGLARYIETKEKAKRLTSLPENE